jgi:hypothetical protein
MVPRLCGREECLGEGDLDLWCGLRRIRGVMVMLMMLARRRQLCVIAISYRALRRR